MEKKMEDMVQENIEGQEKELEKEIPESQEAVPILSSDSLSEKSGHSR